MNSNENKMRTNFLTQKKLIIYRLNLGNAIRLNPVTRTFFRYYSNAESRRA
jgi:hypothetical protein